MKPRTSLYRRIARQLNRKMLSPGEQLCNASASGDLEEMKRLLACGVNPQYVGKKGTPLYRATFHFQQRAVELLIEHGAYTDEECLGMSALYGWFKWIEDVQIVRGWRHPGDIPTEVRRIGLLLALSCPKEANWITCLPPFYGRISLFNYNPFLQSLREEMSTLFLSEKQKRVLEDLTDCAHGAMPRSKRL